MVRTLFSHPMWSSGELWVCARLFDVSKQIFGQMFVHGVNVLISDIVAHLATENACNLYFLNILLDTTFGMGFSVISPHVSEHAFM